MVPLAGLLAGMMGLAGCASQASVDNGPLTPIGDVPQPGADHGPMHDFTGVPPGIGGGANNGPAIPGGAGGGL